MANAKTLSTTCCALAAGFFVGCKSETMTFHDALGKFLERVKGAGKLFSIALSAVQEGTGTAADLRRVHQKCIQTLDEIKEEVRVLKVPSSRSAFRLYDCFRELLQVEEKLMSKMEDLMAIAEDPHLSPAA